MVKEKSSKKQELNRRRILNALIKQADRFLGSESETSRTAVSVWHEKARSLIAEVAGRNSKEVKEIKRIELDPPVKADRYFRKQVGQFLKRLPKNKVIEIPRSRRLHRRRAIAEVKEILLGLKLKHRV